MAAILQRKIEIDCIATTLTEQKAFYDMKSLDEFKLVTTFMLSNEVTDAEREGVYNYVSPLGAYASNMLLMYVDEPRYSLSKKAMELIGVRQDLEALIYGPGGEPYLARALVHTYINQSPEVIYDAANIIAGKSGRALFDDGYVLEGKEIVQFGQRMDKSIAIGGLITAPLERWIHRAPNRALKAAQARSLSEGSSMSTTEARITAARDVLGLDAKASQEWLLQQFAETEPTQVAYQQGRKIVQLKQSTKLRLLLNAGIRNLFPGNLPAADALKVLEMMHNTTLQQAFYAVPGLVERLYTFNMHGMTAAQLDTYKAKLVKAGINLDACSAAELAEVMTASQLDLAGTGEAALPEALQRLIAGLY
ncbi:Hypothetical protein POVN_LOCUS205 [uncultured virus]|nr:Hypothetical protein POVN_LOCUS205 [uncultured virus]